MELGDFSSLRYSSWSDRYFLLKYEQEDKDQADRDLKVSFTLYEPRQLIQSKYPFFRLTYLLPLCATPFCIRVLICLECMGFDTGISGGRVKLRAVFFCERLPTLINILKISSIISTQNQSMNILFQYKFLSPKKSFKICKRQMTS